MIKTYKIQLKGRVQGVGFRPFIYQLAHQAQLKGSVSNNEEGVIIYININTREKAQSFLADILKKKPSVSRITSQLLAEVPAKEFTSFDIIPSEKNGPLNLPLTPDLALCNTCSSEISDPNNRRYRYAFTTCVHCGPRYGITTKYPFDRANTTFADYQMCSDCDEEYNDPNDRRFHSQTNSCSDCGITMQLKNATGAIVTDNQEDILQKVANALAEGKIIAIKSTNGYLLCCDASNPTAISALRQRKKRPNKPFAVLYPTLGQVEQEFDINFEEAKALTSSVAPIVLLKNTKDTSIATAAIAPGLHQTGVLLPSSALLDLIAKDFGQPIVATSGNIHSSPIIAENAAAEEQLAEVADYFLQHNLEITFPQDDSLVRFAHKQQLILRRSRGMAPSYLIDRIQKTSPVLAMGAHLKSSFTFVPSDEVYVSPYFGNLDSYTIFERYRETVEQYTQLFDVQPQTILVDQHAHYQSSVLGQELAANWNTKIQSIQHHKAHFASVLGEHQLFESNEKILGVVWDGTGFGEDHNIWGGEFFSFENQSMERISHFEYYPWLANDKMAKEPRIALFSLLNENQRETIQHKFTETERKIYAKMIESNALKTSSVGRLFDAAASALDLIDINSFEAEAAILLEQCASNYTEGHPIDFLNEVESDTVPSREILQQLIEAYQSGAPKEKLAYSFIYTLAETIIRTAKQNDFKTIACSGGVFQNALLINILRKASIRENIQLKLNQKLSSNDENISFGQFMYHQYIKN